MKSTKIHSCIAAIFALFLGLANAQTQLSQAIKISSPEADLFVIPPANRWHPDSRFMTFFDSAISRGRDVERSTNFCFYVDKKSECAALGENGEFYSSRDIVAAMADVKIKQTKGSSYKYSFMGPLSTLTAEQIGQLRALQEKAFLKSSLMASPDQQSSQMVANRIFGGVVNVALNSYINNNFFAGSANPIAVGSGFLNLNGYALEYAAGGSLVNVPKGMALPPELTSVATIYPQSFSPSDYKSIQYRWVNVTRENFTSSGEFYIAYKVIPTPELEKKLEVQAVVAAFGFDQSMDFVRQSRASELAIRQKNWDDCVQAGACKINQ